MSYTWEPRWEKFKVESNGIVFWTCRDRITGMIACPICVNAYETCINARGGGKGEVIFFYRVEDLIYHLRDYHARSAFRPKAKQ
ncbi:hypothetical protein ACSU1N_07085 [Thermogladius sp. 4427co]|uniref:hypothetical protein n=1 Tax=Thermogladius sp. 4427co TaxID=3450718 RepID=UPI003F798813